MIFLPINLIIYNINKSDMIFLLWYKKIKVGKLRFWPPSWKNFHGKLVKKYSRKNIVFHESYFLNTDTKHDNLRFSIHDFQKTKKKKKKGKEEQKKWKIIKKRKGRTIIKQKKCKKEKNKKNRWRMNNIKGEGLSNQEKE